MYHNGANKIFLVFFTADQGPAGKDDSIPQVGFFNLWFKCNFLNENVLISITIFFKFVSKGPINNIPQLVQVRAWRRPGDKPSSEPMIVRLLAQIRVIRPQWGKISCDCACGCSGICVLPSVEGYPWFRITFVDKIHYTQKTQWELFTWT